MSLPALYNPTIKQGATFRRKLVVPFNLTGATIKGDVRNSDGTVLVSFEFEPENYASDESSVYFLLADTLSLPDTACLPMYPYDIYISLLGGDIICPLEGLITVEGANTDLSEVV
jgi:hypothetical protein